MIQFFTQKKNGAISIMLTLILIPMLAFGSVLMEAARIHSAKALLSELVDNGAFSMLAMYDPDLLGRFGLLAIDPDVSVDDMDKYLREAANEYINDPKNIERILLLQKSGFEAEELFALQDQDVLSRQIMEYSKYRGPISLGASALNLEEIIKQLKKTIQKGLPFLKQMEIVANAANKILDGITSVYKYSDAVNAFEDQVKNYKKTYSKYKSTLKDLIKHWEEEPEKPEKPEHMTEDERESYKEEYEAYQEEKKDYDKEMGKRKEKFNEAKNNYLAAISSLKSGMSAYLSAHNSMKDAINSFGDIARDFQSQRDQISINSGTSMTQEEKDKFTEISDNILDTHKQLQGIFNTISDAISAANTDKYSAYQDQLTAEANHVSSISVDTVNKDSDVDSLTEGYHLDNIDKLCALDMITTAIGAIAQFWSGLAETLAIIVKLIKIIAFFVGGPSIFDLRYVTNIEDDFAAQLPSRTGMAGEESPNQSDDRVRVKGELADSREVAEEVGYDLDNLPASEQYSTGDNQYNSQLQTFNRTLQDMLVKCNDLANPDIFDVLSMGLSQVLTLMGIIADLIILIGCFITMADVILSKLAGAVYQSVMMNTYITGKFSDRTNVGSFGSYASYRADPQVRTVIDDAFGLLGRSMITFNNLTGEGEEDIAFSGAETEYVLYGSMSESANQTWAYMEILFYRLILNVLPVLTDETVSQAMAAATVFAPLVFIIWLALESYMDMQLLTLMDTDVPVYKSQIFLSIEGIDNMLEKIASTKTETMSSRDDIVKGVVKDISDTAKETMKDLSTTEESGGTSGGGTSGGGTSGGGASGGGTSGGGTSGGSGASSGMAGMTEQQKTKAQKAIEKAKGMIVDNIKNWKYSRYLWVMLCLRSNDDKLKRTADLIQMEMSKKRENDGELDYFLLKDAYTYVRLDVHAAVDPILPVVRLPGAESDRLILEKVYYGGY